MTRPLGEPDPAAHLTALRAQARLQHEHESSSRPPRGRRAERARRAFLDPCACEHGPTTPTQAAAMIRMLYSLGITYHAIGDLTRLGLRHDQMREILTVPDLDDQARLIAYFAQ